ncbi:Ionotropic receptor 75j, partial [Halyomorpha halys]
FTTFKVNNETNHLILDKYYYPQDEKINRMYYAFFIYLSNIFNFTLDVLVSETYGYRSDNGTFNGEIRDLILTRADFGMSAIGITNERLNAVDFTANIDDV